MMWNTQYDFLDVVPSESGTRTKLKYDPVIDKHGSLTLKESGIIDTYGRIQSHKDSCDIKLIMQRYANGEEDVLSRSNGVFADLTVYPKTYADMLNTMIKAESAFDSLPADVKMKFDNSINVFLSSVGTPEYFEKLGFVTDNVADQEVIDSAS